MKFTLVQEQQAQEPEVEVQFRADIDVNGDYNIYAKNPGGKEMLHFYVDSSTGKLERYWVDAEYQVKGLKYDGNGYITMGD